MRKKPKVILWDIETLPNMQEVLKVYPKLSDYPGLTMKATITTIICAGWKELGKKQTHCINAWDFPSWRKDVNDDKALCEAIYEVLKDADVVVTHNGRRFDWKHLQTRLLVHKLKPLPTLVHIDTCVLSRSNLLTFNNSLNTLAGVFAKDKKIENGGWDLWVQVHARNKKAMKMMTKYCKHDVVILEKIYKVLRPFAKTLPNHNVFMDDGMKYCPTCGSPGLMKYGLRVTKTGVKQRYACRDCGSQSHGKLESKKPLVV